MTEKLTFHQVGGDAGAVYRHERGVVAQAFLMNRPCQQLLAGAAFPQQQDRRIAFRQPRGIMKERLHGIAFTHDAMKVANLCCLGNRHTLALQYAKDRFANRVQIQRFGQEVIGA